MLNWCFPFKGVKTSLKRLKTQINALNEREEQKCRSVIHQKREKLALWWLAEFLKAFLLLQYSSS
jgi:hypothetical protein